MSNDENLDDDLALFEQHLQQVVAKHPSPPPPAAPTAPQSSADPSPPYPRAPTDTPLPTPRLLSHASPIVSASPHVTQNVLPSSHHTAPTLTNSQQASRPAPTARAPTQSQSHHWKWDGAAWRWLPKPITMTPNQPTGRPLGRPSLPSTTVTAAPTVTSPPRIGPQLPGASSVPAPPAPPTRSPSVSSVGSAPPASVSGMPAPSSATTTKRTAAGAVWQDATLAEWPADDHRIFVGDLAPDAADNDLVQAFSKYSSFNMARVVRDRRTGSCRGYGFVSFGAANDMIAAIKEMNGKYVGSRPVKLRKSNWQKRSLDKEKRKELRAFRTIAKH